MPITCKFPARDVFRAIPGWKLRQELSDITGVRTSNIARFEGGTRIPTLLMLEKYANALGKHIEVSIRDKE